MAPKMSVNHRNPELELEYAKMVEVNKDMADRMGMKGPYHPKNVFPGSPWTPTRLPTPDEVREEANALSKKVLADWSTLKKIVERHHELLKKRWMKKTRKQQKEILLRAWPNMSPTHRPDYEAIRKENTGRQLSGLSKYPEAYMWPYINLDDLSSKSLVIFINSRGRHPPSVFARADVNAMHLGSITHAVEEPAFLPDYTLFLDGETPETYGKLVSWDDDEEAADLMFSQRQFTPGEGLRAFEIQERIYPFLVKCCELILHDLADSGSLFDGKFPIQDDTASLTQSISQMSLAEGEVLPTLSSISAEAPYRLPAKLDLERIRGIIAAKRSAAEDNLWALREDPGYFSDTVMDWSEHRNDRLLDWNGNPHPTGPHTVDFWERVIRNVIADAYSGFMNWDLLLRHINRLVTLQKKYKDEILYDRQLPHKYLIALLKFRKLLAISCESPIFYLRNIQSSPPLRQYFHRAPQQPGTINMDIRPINETEPFFAHPWGLLLILWDPDQRNLFGLTNVIDSFEHLMRDPNEKRNLSPYILDLFSDLSVLTRALHELEIYQPWAATFDDEQEQHGKEIMELFEEASYQMELMEQMDHVLKGIVPFAMPKDGKFNYPTDKKRTKQTTEAMIKAEQKLDLFWRKYDANWKKLTGKTINESMGDHIPSHRGQKMARTAPWVEPIKEPKPTSETKEPKQSTNIQDDKLPIETKQKPKTKGVGKAVETGKTPSEAPGEQTDVQPPRKVDKRALKVFNTLFHTPNQNDHPGEIPWQDFLHAMASTGFALQKLYGSIWQFTPTKLDVERSIQFHEPHPGVKIQFKIARRIGRRLTRAYGWHSGMFVLE